LIDTFLEVGTHMNEVGAIQLIKHNNIKG